MQVASSTTKDKGIARLPRRGTNAISLLFLLADGPASTRRRASIWHSSRSQHTSPYLWKGVPRPALLSRGHQGQSPESLLLKAFRGE